MKLLKRQTKNSLAGDVTMLSVSRVITYAVSLVTSMLLSRFRTLEEYGTYSQLLLMVNLFSTLFMMGLPNCINYFLARAETQEERNAFLSVYYILNTILSLVVGLVLVLAVPLFEIYFNNPALGKYILFLAVFPWTRLISSSVENLLVVHKKSAYLMTYRVLHSFSLLFCILLIQYLSLSFVVYVYLYLIFEVVFTITVYVIAIRLDGMFTWKIDFASIKKILIFSIPLGLSSVAATLKMEMDKLVIGFFYTTEEYALYANAAKEMPVTFIAASVTAVIMPIIARLLKGEKTEDALNLWGDATVVSYLLNAFFAFGLFTFSEEAMTFLYSEKYVAGAPVFALYSLVLLFRSTYFGILLQSSGNTKQIMHSATTSMVINLILNIVLYYVIGFVGPAVATIIATAWSAGFQLYKTSRVLHKPVKAIFPWKYIGIISLVNIILGIASHLLKVTMPLERYITTSGEAFFLAFLWLAVYLLIFRKTLKQKSISFQSYSKV